MADRNDLRKTNPGDGPETPISGPIEHVDHAGSEPSGHGVNGDQNSGWNEDPGTIARGYPRDGCSNSADPLRFAASTIAVCGTSLAGVLSERGGQSPGSGKVPAHCSRHS